MWVFWVEHKTLLVCWFFGICRLIFNHPCLPEATMKAKFPRRRSWLWRKRELALKPGLSVWQKQIQIYSWWVKPNKKDRCRNRRSVDYRVVQKMYVTWSICDCCPFFFFLLHAYIMMHIIFNHRIYASSLIPKHSLQFNKPKYADVYCNGPLIARYASHLLKWGRKMFW